MKKSLIKIVVTLINCELLIIIPITSLYQQNHIIANHGRDRQNEK